MVCLSVLESENDLEKKTRTLKSLKYGNLCSHMGDPGNEARSHSKPGFKDAT